MEREPDTTAGDIGYRTFDGDEATLPRSTLEALRGAIRGGVLSSADAGFDTTRRVWNAMIDRQPALIARCTSSSDVREAVRFARACDMLLTVRCGGHHIAGNAVADGGLLIDLAPMRSVHVDVAARRARIGGGALLGDVDQETQSFGLAVPLGINSTTGFGGLCLGGGFGWLTRSFGLTVDNLVSADVVTADGDVRVASASSEADLFWAIRGGGGNFGVVTSFEVALHDVGPILHAGFVVYPAAQARDVLRGWRDVADAAPDALTAWVVLRKAPPLPFLPASAHGTDVVILVAVYGGPLADGVAATRPLTELGTPIGTMLGPMPYVALQQAFDPLLAAGARNYWKTNEFAELQDEALDVIADAARASPGPECELFVGQLGGAMGRVPRDATAYAGRDAHYVMNVHGRWRSAEDDAKVRSWARAIFQRTAPFATGGGYVNFLAEDDASRVAAAYGENYDRLRELKRRYDPDNVFRMNHNIPPAAAGERRGGGARRRPAAPPG